MSASVYCSLNAIQPLPRGDSPPRASAPVLILRQTAVVPGALRARADAAVETRETESAPS
ncbi:hypothetical protein [Paludibacterium yongneupense]|uniref:hypothetical protein n=1 Tax=Paludibacterium yongneupense TaxID=400061 RepID=UPI000414EB0A|nr:hypothetical protein [Paludibacterium yongneupense]